MAKFGDSFSGSNQERHKQESIGSTGGDHPDEYLTMMFDICRTDDGKASVSQFLEEIQKTGIQVTDPRMSNMIRKLEALTPPSLNSFESLKLDSPTFKMVLSENVVLVTKALQNQMVIPAFEAFCDNITRIYQECEKNNSGTPASIIAQLDEDRHDNFGVGICTIDGQRFSLGQASTPFTMQSTCTPLTYALTLNELGEQLVHKYQGMKPSGRMFNEIVLDDNNKPHNPLVSSGAIMSAALMLSLVRPDLADLASKFEFTIDFLRDMAGGEHLSFNNSVFLAERDAADRNFALAYFMRENGCLPEGVDIKKALDFHFQLCSLEMTCESSSVVAATLANGGVCPITGKKVLEPASVQHVRSLMYSCGMYNYSGQFAFSVGLPAKAGGSGALMLVVPNVMGITLWSPPLDQLGNSVRGVQFCKQLVNIYRFHRFDGIRTDEHVNCGRMNSKLNPTYKKHDSASQLVIQILLAATAGDLKALQVFWLQDIDLSVGDYDGRTALHLAAAEGHIDCVKFLLEVCKVSPSPLDRWNRCPLTEAVLFEQARVATYLKEFIETHHSETEEELDDDDDNEEGNLSFETEADDHSSSSSGCSPFIKSKSMRSKLRALSDDNPSIKVSRGSLHYPPAIPPHVSDVNGMGSHGRNRRRSISCLLGTRPAIRVNTRSPRISPGGSPTLPRAQFSCNDISVD